MTFSPTTALQLLVVFQCAFFAVFLLVRRSRFDPPTNLSLSAILGLLAAHLGTMLLQQAGRIAWGVTTAQLSGLLYGPLFLVFIRSLTFRRRLRPADGLHLLPVGLAFCFFVAGVLAPELLAVAVFISLGAYLVLAMRTIHRYRWVLASTRSDVRRIPYSWLSFAVAGLLVVYVVDLASFIAGEVGQRDSALLTTLLSAALLIYVTGFVVGALEQPLLFSGVSEEERTLVSAQKVASLGPEELEDLKRLELFVAEKRPYLDQQLTLLDLARIAGMPARRLSRLVNRGHSQTFSEWINDHRIEEAKRLLSGAGTASSTILDVLYRAGFNSKSTFNAVFKERTGLTPGEYRRRAQY
ncbi:MAG: helix-turn-helix domain-containing protein [Thermoanaerobaculaceae bacterium]|jgi:AraC-like DNA-binding protein